MNVIRKFFNRFRKGNDTEDGHVGLHVHKPSKSTVIKAVSFFVACVLLTAVSVFIVSASVCGSVSGLIVSVDEAGTYGFAMILGARVHGDGTPSDMLRDRIIFGASLYKNGNVSKLLMSGDSEKDGYDETSAMKKYAVEVCGIPEEDIICDGYGLSTYDSIVRAKNVYGIKSFVIVTQEYHLYRALYIAKKNDCNVCGVPSDLDIYSGQTKRDLREILARFKDFFSVQLECKPKYLTGVSD